MIGNCMDCHTVEGGESFAGGRAIPTPLGTIITPDEETGIGDWSEEAFRRAMYQGLDREGSHLYPAFPYHHFTKVAAEDINAIYAYLMTLEPVGNEAPANRLAFPFNLRPLLAGWKLLYLDDERFAALPNTDEQVNRGAYLVEGLGHCGGCHEAEPARFAQGLQLAYSTSLRIPEPRNLIHIVQGGVQPPDGRPGFYMPGFAGALTEEQMVALASNLRERFTGFDPWEDLEGSDRDHGRG